MFTLSCGGLPYVGHKDKYKPSDKCQIQIFHKFSTLK